MPTPQEMTDQIDDLTCLVQQLTGKLDQATYTVYRYTPAVEPGLRARWWLAAAGPHVDPLEWDGPIDTVSGFPLPTSIAPDFDVINNGTNVSDSTSGAGQARYGIVDGWVFITADATHWRDNNQNTGELGMVLSGLCCGGALIEQAGGNHTEETATADRGLMDSTPVPATGQWVYVFSPQSDQSAFGGIDLEISTDGGNTWQEVTQMRPTIPVVESMEVPFCDPVPDGWQKPAIDECCQPKWGAGGPGPQGEQGIQGLPGPQGIQGVPGPVDNQEICTGDFVDVTGRSGWLHTWTPSYTANSGTIIEDWAQVSTAEVSPNCVTDMTVNVDLGNSYFQLRNMYGRVWFDVRLLVDGAAVTTWTFAKYHYEDDLGEANLSDDITPVGSVHFARPNVPAGATITVEIGRRHNFVAGNAAIAAPFGRVISGLRSHFNVQYSPTQIVTGRV